LHQTRLDLETKAGHASLVLIDSRLALLGGVIGLGEEHAVIASGLLILADAAGLYMCMTGSVMIFADIGVGKPSYLGLVGLGRLRLGLCRGGGSFLYWQMG
jgi:hypothetical protein